jgi:hypothetical protein
MRYAGAIDSAIKGNALQIRPHPPTPSPRAGEGEPDWKSLSRSGRGIKAYGIKEKGEGKCIDNSCQVNNASYEIDDLTLGIN